MKRNRLTVIVRGLLLAVWAAMGLVGCAAQIAEDKKPLDIVWPLPPEEPRVKYVGLIQTNLDVVPSGGIAASLFGEDEVIQLTNPYGVGTDRTGRLLIADIGAVHVFDMKNKKYSRIGISPGNGRIETASAVAASKIDGRIYVTDIAAHRLYVYDEGGSFITAFGKEGDLETPTGVTVDDRLRRVYVVDTKKHHVKAYGFDGSDILTIGKRGHNEGEFNFPLMAALDSKGNIYVSDMQNFRVQVFDSQGKFLKTFGKIGDAVGNFARPKGIALDSEGNVYVVDAAFQNVQIMSESGQPLLFFGSGGYLPGQLSLPAGIAIDDDDKIYIAEQVNRRVQIFQYMGERWKQRQLGKPDPSRPAEKK